ncbi:MAG: hypothetical protein H6821_08735 [Planctomycetaceae bacterium]|nr:hypothetical protein [Planctomycetaceae bacterium]MCB9874253.1 hypothetical protein [Planctomycetaceae bacterium]
MPTADRKRQTPITKRMAEDMLVRNLAVRTNGATPDKPLTSGDVIAYNLSRRPRQPTSLIQSYQFPNHRWTR